MPSKADLRRRYDARTYRPAAPVVDDGPGTRHLWRGWYLRLSSLTTATQWLDLSDPQVITLNASTVGITLQSPRRDGHCVNLCACRRSGQLPGSPAAAALADGVAWTVQGMDVAIRWVRQTQPLPKGDVVLGGASVALGAWGPAPGDPHHAGKP